MESGSGWAGLWPENHWALVLEHHLSGCSWVLQLGASFALRLPPACQIISSEEELLASGKEKGWEESFSQELGGLSSLVPRKMVLGRSYQRDRRLSPSSWDSVSALAFCLGPRARTRTQIHTL